MIDLICEWGVPRSLDHALEQVQATRHIGASYAKFQIFDPLRIASADAARYWDPGLGGSRSQLATFRAAGGLDSEEWSVVSRACKACEVEFLATPFDLEAVDLLESLDVRAYKVASGDITYRALLRRVARAGQRVFLSTGAASVGEIDRAVEWLGSCEVVRMACDLVYPCPPADANLARTIPRLEGTVGYSDHTRELITGAVAVSLGARVLEKHITLDPGGDAPDDHMALTVRQAQIYRVLAEQAATLCAEVQGDPEQAARVGARRSAYAARSLERGQTLRDKDIAWLRPCPPGAIDATQDITGTTLAHPVSHGERILQSDLEVADALVHL